MAAVGAAVLLGVGFVTGCGNDGAEPPAKGSSEGENQDKGNGQKQTGNEKPDKPKEPEEYVFVKEYVDAINEVSAGRGTAELLEMSTDDCQGCDQMVQYHKDVYDAGGKYIGDPSWEVLKLAEGPEGSDPVLVRIETLEPAVKLIEKKGASPQELEEAEELTDFELVKEGGVWKVANFCGVTEGQPLGCSF